MTAASLLRGHDQCHRQCRLRHAKRNAILTGIPRPAWMDAYEASLRTALGTKEKRAMFTQQGPVNANAFVSLVKQAVDGHWVQSGRMKNVQK